MEDKRQSITKSELIEKISAKIPQLGNKDVELSVKALIDKVIDSLATGERTEIRGFGSFSVHYRKPRIGRNPKTGDSVSLPGKNAAHFKPGKVLRNKINNSHDTD
jgi:integration host factor subunit beta|tara:strand:- start:162 stop:476 length:315 start_codon:yes stop_codon:yes gene_type:complete